MSLNGQKEPLSADQTGRSRTAHFAWLATSCSTGIRRIKQSPLLQRWTRKATAQLMHFGKEPAAQVADGGPLPYGANHSVWCAAYDGHMDKPYFVRAEWDADAAVWVATSDDVPGLVTEAETIEALDAKLRSMVPELLEANGCMPADGRVAVELLARRFSVALPAAV